MGFLDRLIGPPSTGSAGSIGVQAEVTPGNTPPSKAEQDISAAHRPRREAACRHYRETSDGIPMLQAKADEVAAINAHRRPRRR